MATHPLSALLEPETLAAHEGAALRIVQVSEPDSFAAAHVPGARLVTPRELVDGRPPAPGRLPETDRLAALFGRLDHRPDLHYVVYDDEGGGWAGRFIWTLDVIGHERWSYLNGGIHAWIADGHPLERGPPPPVAPSRVTVSLRPGPIAELDDVLDAIDDPDQLIWDARSPEEYRGERRGAARAGHVPGALNLDWLRLKDPDRHQRLADDLEGLLAAHGIDPRKRVITHCQSHHRSGLSYLVGRLLRFREIRGYHGSWAEWGNHPATPVARGPAPGAPPSGADPEPGPVQ